MKFIWAEISYFSRFFEDLGEKKKKQMKMYAIEFGNFKLM